MTSSSRGLFIGSSAAAVPEELRQTQVVCFTGGMASREMQSAFKGKGPNTRQMLKAVAEGKTVRPVWGVCNPVHHEPRTKFDPQPWTDGFFRYHAWELHAEDPKES